jgi:hypothetical protein
MIPDEKRKLCPGPIFHYQKSIEVLICRNAERYNETRIGRTEAEEFAE